MDRAQILICGAGIVGLTLARELLQRGFGGVTVIEKESAAGRHASGRNSGVLHSGVYYSPGSMRAASCASGNRLMREYCRARGLPLVECGKVIVARNEAETAVLEALLRRAAANGAAVEMVDEATLARTEPLARTSRAALLCRDTAVIDPLAVLRSLEAEIASAGARVSFGVSFIGPDGPGVARTTAGRLRYGLFINAAGAYSDIIAHAFGVGRGLRLLPIRGSYRRLAGPKAALVKGSIYGAPDLGNPFLGVHFTRVSSGDVYVGPTAMPALGRENYGLLEGVGTEALAFLGSEAVLFATNSSFRRLAVSETARLLPGLFFREAARLVNGLVPADLEPCPKAGIRPQLVDWEKKELVTDFLVERGEDSVHILNAISPAMTCSMEFAKVVASEFVAGFGRLR